MIQAIGGKGGLKIDIEHRLETLFVLLLRIRAKRENQWTINSEICLPFPYDQDPHD
jgi:hypothetical protein